MNNLPAPDRVVSEIEQMLRTLREYADTDELKRLGKLLRRSVPFSLRSYFHAFMLQRLLGSAPAPGSDIRSERGSADRPKRARNEAARRKTTPVAVASGDGGNSSDGDSSGDGDDLRRLFVSIGRNRRVQPHELISLFATKITINEADFGTIKILDKYSFVEVPAAVAQQAVDELTGTTFKDRRITVDFARSRG